jgi:transposase-like protein
VPKTREFNDPDLFLNIKKAVIERVLDGKLTHNLGYPKHAELLDNNNRNGSSSKTLKTQDGEIFIEVPRDREYSFEPILRQTLYNYLDI